MKETLPLLSSVGWEDCEWGGVDSAGKLLEKGAGPWRLAPADSPAWALGVTLSCATAFLGESRFSASLGNQKSQVDWMSRCHMPKSMVWVGYQGVLHNVRFTFNNYHNYNFIDCFCVSHYSHNFTWIEPWSIHSNHIRKVLLLSSFSNEKTEAREVNWSAQSQGQEQIRTQVVWLEGPHANPGTASLVPDCNPHQRSCCSYWLSLDFFWLFSSSWY